MPFGTVIDSRNRVYLNDRRNYVVVRLDSDGVAEASYAHSSAAEEIAYGWTDADDSVYLFLFGPASCPSGGTCTAVRMSISRSGELHVDAFAEMGGELPPIATWTGAVDRQNRQVYVANVASNEVLVFDDANRPTRQLVLDVPDGVPVRGTNQSRPYGYDAPRINRIAFTRDRLIVQWIASGLAADTYRFLISVYDSNGNPLGKEFPTDMQLVTANEGLVMLASFSDEGAGRLLVRRYRIAS
jgi:hypothetical protein